MKNVFKLTVIALALILMLGMTLPAAAQAAPSEEDPPVLPAVEGTVSPFGVYVNGIAVTEENKNDIFGDVVEEDSDSKNVAEPRAVYYENDRELVLTGNIKLDGATTMGGVKYSLLTTDKDEDIHVSVTEGSTVSFEKGVYIYRGSFSSLLANITFDTPCNVETLNEGSEAFVRVENGYIHMKDSRVECVSTAMISVVAQTLAEGEIPTGVGFVADNIILERGTRLIVDSASRTVPLYAVLWAKEGIEIASNATVYVKSLANECFADAFLRAEKYVRLSDANINVSGVDCTFALPEANLNVRDHSEVVSTAASGIVVGGECTIEGESYIELATGRSGIAVVGEDASFRAENDTRFYLTGTQTPVSPRSYAWTAYPQAAFYGYGCPVAFKNVKFTANSHTFGILCCSTSDRLSFTGRYDIFAQMAFFALSERKEDVSFGTEIKGDVTLFSIPAFGAYASSLTPHEGVLAVRGNTFDTGDLSGALTSFSGYTGECHIQVAVFPVAAIIAPAVLLVVIAVVIIIMYKTGHIFVGRRRTRENGPEEALVPATDVSSDTIESDEGGTSDADN